MRGDVIIVVQKREELGAVAIRDGPLEAHHQLHCIVVVAVDEILLYDVAVLHGFDADAVLQRPIVIPRNAEQEHALGDVPGHDILLRPRLTDHLTPLEVIDGRLDDEQDEHVFVIAVELALRFGVQHIRVVQRVYRCDFRLSAFQHLVDDSGHVDLERILEVSERCRHHVLVDVVVVAIERCHQQHADDRSVTHL